MIQFEKVEPHARQAAGLPYSGTVTAASEWDAPAECKQVRPGRCDSCKGLFHEVGLPSFLLDLRAGGDGSDVVQSLCDPRLERAIGVIRRPESERISHYFHATLHD